MLPHFLSDQGGLIDPAESDQAWIAVMEIRDSFMESADDELERELFARLWPYQNVDRVRVEGCFVIAFDWAIVDVEKVG
jgi:hypothetical protein